MQTDRKVEPADLLPPFEIWLPAALRLSGELKLLLSHGLNRENYSTRRLLSKSPEYNGAILKTLAVAGGNLFLCESPSPDLVRYCAERGLGLADNATADRAARRIEDALLTVIEPFPSLWSAVSELVWRCHVLSPPDDYHDVSFSDPAIPFSVFVSAPIQNDRNSVLRVAENLIHETMHLQLTLLEEVSPLVDTTSSWSMYSPWKQQKRLTQGILHGLYVFCVLRWMWWQVSELGRNSADQEFAIRRLSEIDKEVSAVQAIEESPALTDDGRRFLRQLFVAYDRPPPTSR
jgi:HEXXH motif-containing protein